MNSARVLVYSDFTQENNRSGFAWIRVEEPNRIFVSHKDKTSVHPDDGKPVFDSSVSFTISQLEEIISQAKNVQSGALSLEN